MYCQKCGTPEQQENSYCRNCGEFLPDSNIKTKMQFGGSTPDEQIRTNLFLNLLSALVSFALAVTLYLTFWHRGDALPVIYIVAAFLLAMSFWQTSTFYVGLKLKKNFDKRKSATSGKENQENTKTFESAKTRELLNEPNLENFVPASITENTTRHLCAFKSPIC